MRILSQGIVYEGSSRIIAFRREGAIEMSSLDTFYLSLLKAKSENVSRFKLTTKILVNPTEHCDVVEYL